MAASLTVRNHKISSENPVICVPIVKTTLREVLEEVNLCVQQKISLIELRADYWNLSDANQIIEGLKHIRMVAGDAMLIFTVRSAKEGGKGQLSVEECRTLFTAVAASGYVDLVDIEYFSLPIADSIIQEVHKYGVKIICSHHNFSRTPGVSEIVNRLLEMDAGGADIVKVAVMPTSAMDVARLLEATAEYCKKDDPKPAITMSMGEMGMVSRIAGKVFGSCVTFATIHEASAPGQLPVDKVKEAMRILG